MSSIVSIVRSSDGAVKFSPDPLRIAPNTAVVFRNEDPQAAHLVHPQGKDANLWFRFPLAAYVAGRPADVSDEVLFSSEGQTVYVSSAAPGSTGTIAVVK